MGSFGAPSRPHLVIMYTAIFPLEKDKIGKFWKILTLAGLRMGKTGKPPPSLGVRTLQTAISGVFRA